MTRETASCAINQFPGADASWLPSAVNGSTITSAQILQLDCTAVSSDNNLLCACNLILLLSIASWYVTRLEIIRDKLGQWYTRLQLVALAAIYSTLLYCPLKERVFASNISSTMLFFWCSTCPRISLDVFRQFFKHILANSSYRNII